MSMKKIITITAINSLQELFEQELKEAYDAELQLEATLPTFIKAPHSLTLKKALEEQLQDTRNQISRIENIFSMINLKPERCPCGAMAEMITRAHQLLSISCDKTIKDVVLIGFVQKMKHYEIALYGSLIVFADILSLAEPDKLLVITLEEEKKINYHLTEIALGKARSEAPSKDFKKAI